MELGLHLPLMEFRDEGQSLDRLNEAVDAARECGLAAISANDHFFFSTPWLDGLTALAAVIERSGGMELSTTVSLAALRGPVPLAKTLTALDVLSDGRVIAGVGPGSSTRDFEAIGVPFAERWARFEESVTVLRLLLRGEAVPAQTHFYPLPDGRLAPSARRKGGVPVWIGSWGSEAGLRRVARLADGWLASAYNTTPERFLAARDRLSTELAKTRGWEGGFPNAVVTMWTWVTDDRADAERALRTVLAPLCVESPTSSGGKSASVPRSTARSFCPATPRPAASGSTSGRSGKSAARSSALPGTWLPSSEAWASLV